MSRRRNEREIELKERHNRKKCRGKIKERKERKEWREKEEWEKKQESKSDFHSVLFTKLQSTPSFIF